MAELMIAQPMKFRVDIKTGLVERPQRESLMRGDKKANRIIAELFAGDEPFDLTGVTVKGKFCKPPNGDAVELAGEVQGNLAIVQLDDACYTQDGHYTATVSLVLNDVERTVLLISGDVLRSGSGNAAGDDPTGGGGGNTGSGLPAGGTAGQVLVKVSGVQGAAVWKTLTAQDVGALGKAEQAADSAKLGGKAPEYYLQPRNLLDNSDFRNPVNQRGATWGTACWTYFIDRWLLVSVSGGNVTFDINTAAKAVGFSTSNGETFAFIQRFPKGIIDITKTYTLAYKVKDGNVAVKATSFETGSESFDALNIWLDSGTYLEWVALYEGEYTAETLPPYVPKGYSVELAECQRYYCKITGQYGVPMAFGMVYGDTNCKLLIPTPATMRGNPSVITTTSKLRITTATGSQHIVSSISTPIAQGNGVSITVIASGALSNYVCALFMDTNAEFALSADL